jgi:hypothetical protein
MVTQTASPHNRVKENKAMIRIQEIPIVMAQLAGPLKPKVTVVEQRNDNNGTEKTG